MIDPQAKPARAWVLRYELRRLAQTPRAFTNWPQLLTGLVREKVGKGPAELTFHTRAGQTISIPNAPGARVPPYEVFADDAYDLRWFLGELVDGPVHALDLGAHVGTFSTLFGLLHPSATIDCFEPSPDTFEYLRRNIEANGLAERVRVHQKALAGETGYAVFDLQGAGSGHNHLAFGEVEGSSVKVATVTFDEVVADARGPVEVVKMDCEGGEYDLVYRSSPESWAAVQRLVLEYHDVKGESWEELRAWFAGVGLHVLRDERGPIAGTAWLSRSPLRDPEGHDGRRSRLRSFRYEAKRVRQTPRAFSNWPSLLSGLVRGQVGRGPELLTFRTRSGQQLTSPNVAGARLPAYEQFAEDGYRLGWFLASLQDQPMHGIDVGAHVGTFACRFAEVHPTATLTCFEPSAGTARFLRRNIDQNGLSARISVVEAALSGETGFAMFEDHGGASVHSGLAEDHPVDDPDVGVGKKVQVRTLGFDDAIAAERAPVTFVKLDCEGGEYQLAYRSSPASWDTVERVVLEYHDVPGESWADLRAWFAGVGLHLVAQKSDRADLGLAWLSRTPLG